MHSLQHFCDTSAFAVWFARPRFQPEIERNLTKIEAAAAPEEGTIVGKHRLINKTN